MLRLDVERDLRRSAADFEALVWPVSREHCGGGTLVRVERAPGVVAALLDQDLGIDYVQHVGPGVAYGIAARVQWVNGTSSFDTFTVRMARDSGTATEPMKRVSAFGEIHHYPLWPRWTIQAYVADGTGVLLAVGVISTIALYAHIRAGREGSSWRKDRTDNADFLYVPWVWLPGYTGLWVWRAP